MRKSVTFHNLLSKNNYYVCSTVILRILARSEIVSKYFSNSANAVRSFLPKCSLNIGALFYPEAAGIKDYGGPSVPRAYRIVDPIFLDKTSEKWFLFALYMLMV